MPHLRGRSLNSSNEQVDDLEEIGNLEGYIDRTATVLIYCSKGYFESKNCFRELVSSTTKDKPIIALVDLDATRGGLSFAEIHVQLLKAEDSYTKWGFDLQTTPDCQKLHDHLFASVAIEWNRIGHFQVHSNPAMGHCPTRC